MNMRSHDLSSEQCTNTLWLGYLENEIFTHTQKFNSAEKNSAVSHLSFVSLP